MLIRSHPIVMATNPVPHTPGVLAIDGTPVSSNFSGGTSGSVTLTTTLTDDIIVVCVATEKSAVAVQTVSTVSSPNLASGVWTRRASKTEANQQNLEIWWAKATAALTGEVITVNISAATDDATIIAFAVHGANLTVPFDVNGSLPATGGGNGATASVTGVSTTNADTMLIGVALNRNGQSYATKAEAGYTLIKSQDNAGGARFSNQGAERKIVSATQSGVTVAFQATAGVDWIMIADAIQAS